MKPEIRLVVCDLDGTLLSPDHRLTDRVIAALGAYRQTGGRLTIATGRPMMSAAAIAARLEIELPAIYCNGAVIADPRKVWHSTEFDAAPFRSLRQAAARESVELLLFDSSNVYTFRRSLAIERYERKEGISCVMIDEKEMSAGLRLNKLLLIGPIAAIEKIWNESGSLIHAHYTALQSEDNFLEIVPSHINKGAALRRLMAIMGLEPEQVMAIGNQVNDLELLREAGIGVAVGNSHPLLLKQADYICRGEYGEGVIEALQRFGCRTDKLQIHGRD